MENQVEIWKDVLGYEDLYQISNFGKVKSIRIYPRGKKSGDKILKPSSYRGYLRVCLYKNGISETFQVHQLVAIAFLGHNVCGFELVVNHKDFNRANNHKDNLEIVTMRENGNKKHLPSISEYTGVFLNKKTKKWVARIVLDKKSTHLGTFDNEIEASNCYENALNCINNGTEIIFRKHIPTSKHKGISFCNTHNKWVVQLTINKKRIRVGYYGSESEAIVAKDKYLTH